jgi:pimeloyl-ACP methyl ester carboxylesterase
MRTLPILFAMFAASTAAAADLPRRAGAAAEEHPGIAVDYGELERPGGVRLRTILTRPAGVERPPVVLYVQWLSCDTVELDAGGQDGWTRMLRGLVRDSGWAVLRTDKRGVGDSGGGPCGSLDYETELADHAAALESLRRRTDVDPRRIVVFGASMGANMAPLLAAGQEVAGVMVWGGGARTWFERTLAFERRAKELGSLPAAELDPYVRSLTRFLVRYLLDRQTPETIARAEPSLGAVWSRMVGTAPGSHYGRPLAFHQQAQARDWSAAWARVEAPVLVLFGEYDWFEEAAGAARIADLVDRGRPGRARFALLPRTDHHFTRYPDPVAAFEERGGEVAADAALSEMLAWLRALPGGR